MKGKERIIVTLMALFIFCFTTVGYAVYTVNANITGQAKFLKNGSVIIESAILTDYKNLENPANPQINDTRISFDLNFNVARTDEALNDDYYATYTITITNDSVYDYTFQAGNFTPSLNTESNEDMSVSYHLDGITPNEVIPSKESKTFTLTIVMIPNNAGNFNVSGETDIDLQEETIQGSLIGTIPSNITGDLTNTNNRVPITASVLNSYETAKTFNITVSNDNFYLVDSNNNPLQQFSINANSEQDYPIYLKVKNTARFATNRQSVNIIFEPTDGTRSSMGVVTVTVPKDETLVDTQPPTISNVVGTFQATKGNVVVTYDGNDNIGISHYIIETYKVNDNGEELVDTYNTGADISTYTKTNLSDGTYYFKVQAVDTSGLTATAESTPQEYRWTMNVTITISGGGPNGTYTVDYGGTYSTTITANNNRTIPDSLTVKMNGQTVNNNRYTYRNGQFSITNVTGDLEITGETGTCLVAGTKVKLANNKEKNIEDIKYDDLLLVWSYDTGSPTKEYPIWIEKEKKTNNYTKITFSDNSEIKIVGNHSFFSTDYNEFISALDKEKFHVGTSVLKVDKNNKLKKVKITKIDQVEEEVNYYFVASTRYYNIITNDFITTDGYTEITNLYEFDSNISWKNRKVKTIDYKYLEDVLPYYMYKGFRAGELAILLDKGQSDLESFKSYITEFIINTNMVKDPIMKNNHRYWPVSTSNSSKKKLVKEGSYYQLPKLNNNKRWYSTSEHKYYKSGEKVKVWTGMYFEEK